MLFLFSKGIRLDVCNCLAGDRRLVDPGQVEELVRACAQQAASAIGPPLRSAS